MIFFIHVGDQSLVLANPGGNWYGSNPTITFRHLRHGLDPLSGTFQITLEVDNSEPLLHNLDKSSVKSVLESLIIIGEVQVTRFPNNNGFYYLSHLLRRWEIWMPFKLAVLSWMSLIPKLGLLLFDM